MRLTVRERERGWVIHSCPVHGPLVAMTPRATVRCGGRASLGKRCNKVAAVTLDGQTALSRQERARLKASKKSLQMKG